MNEAEIISPKPSSYNGRIIYYSIAAQSENLGDLAIRKVVLDWLTETGLPMKIFVGHMPASYVEAFGLDNRNYQLYTSSFKFQLALVRDLLARRAHLVFAPGPQILGGTASAQHSISLSNFLPLGKQTINLFNTLAVRATGGKTLSIGRSLRGYDRMSLLLERTRQRFTSIYCVRDTTSSRVLDRPLKTVPDVAFQISLVPTADCPRPLMILSFRGDTTIEAEAVKHAATLAMHNGLQPVLLTQVKTDARLHRQLSNELQIEHIDWGQRTHREQMLVVESTYNAAQVVISNRLHSLIFGARVGATPIAVSHEGNDKLHSTLAHIVPTLEVAGEDVAWTKIQPRHLNGELRRDILAAVSSANSSLEDLRSELLLVIGETLTSV